MIDFSYKVAELEAEITRLRSDNQKLREALEISLWYGPSDFFRARAALAATDMLSGLDSAPRTGGERRDRGLNDLAATIEHLWGPRCSRNEGGCGCCTAWAIFDCMEKLTDSSSLDCAPKAQGASLTGVEDKSGVDVAEEAKGGF